MVAELQRNVRIARSACSDTRAALAEVTEGLGGSDDLQAVLFAVGRTHDRDTVARYMVDHWPERALGCVVAPPGGSWCGSGNGASAWQSGGLLALGIVTGSLSARIVAFDDLRDIPLHQFERARQDVDDAIGSDAGSPVNQRLGVLLVDGSSHADQYVGAVVHRAFRRMPILGGVFQSTGAAAAVFGGDRFLDSGGALLVVQGHGLDHHQFVVHDVEEIGEPMVVTVSDVEKRWISELDGAPAFEVLAETIGCEESALRDCITDYSLVVQTADVPHSRALCRIGPGGVELQAGIDTGIVVRLGRLLASAPGSHGRTPIRDHGADRERATILFESKHRQQQAATIDDSVRLSSADLPCTFAVPTHAEIVGSRCLHHSLAGMELEPDAYAS